MIKNNHKCYIGLWNDYDNTELLTVYDLKEKLQYQSGKYLLKDYTDKRKSTNLYHFNFCPICGKEINYKRLREDLNNGT